MLFAHEFHATDSVNLQADNSRINFSFGKTIPATFFQKALNGIKTSTVVIKIGEVTVKWSSY